MGPTCRNTQDDTLAAGPSQYATHQPGAPVGTGTTPPTRISSILTTLILRASVVSMFPTVFHVHPTAIYRRIPTRTSAKLIPAGPDGQETFNWAKAAGMTGFETFWHRCTKALEKGFAWPDGVTSIQFPTNDGKNFYTVKKKD